MRSLNLCCCFLTTILIKLIRFRYFYFFKECQMQRNLSEGWTFGNQRHIGSRIYYTCRHGYDLYQSSFRVCQDNGTWSGAEPICTYLSNLLILLAAQNNLTDFQSKKAALQSFLVDSPSCTNTAIVFTYYCQFDNFIGGIRINVTMSQSINVIQIIILKHTFLISQWIYSIHNWNKSVIHQFYANRLHLLIIFCLLHIIHKR